MIRILIVDDQNLVREGIKTLLEKITDVSIVGDAANATVGLQKIESLEPDIVLLDIEMPGVDGLALADRIRLKFPKVKVIILSSHEDKSYVEKATAVGAKGYLLKSVSSKELEWSIKLVEQGYSAIKSELLEARLSVSVDADRSRLNTPPAEEPLYLSGAKKDKQVALEFNSSQTTVLSEKDQENLEKLETLLSKNQFKQKQFRQQHYRYQRPKANSLFPKTRSLRFRKTVGSFEFRLLTFIILFSLAFLTFIALS